MKYTIGGMEFQSKKDAHKFISAWLHSATPVEVIDNGKKFSFLSDLIFRHPDAMQKTGCGIQRFEIRNNPVFKHQKTFYLIRLDGTETDFSFRLCLSGRSKSEWSDFCQAARNAISGQIITYKTSRFISIEKPVCEITGEEIEFNSCHVDHVIPFEKLIRQFVAERGIDVSKCVAASVDGQIVPRFASDSVQSDWADFHQQNAVLRLTTPKANMSRKISNEH